MKFVKRMCLVLFVFSIFAFCGCSKAELVSIKVNTENAKVSFSPSEEFSYDGLKVVATYDDGTTKDVSKFDVDAQAFVKGQIGQYEIVVSYTEKSNTVSDKYKVEVTYGSLQSLKLDLTKTKRVFYLGEDFNWDGLVVNAVYANDVVEVKDYNVSCLSYNKNQVGTYSVTVEYKSGVLSKKEYYNVEVVDKMSLVKKLIGLNVYFGDEEAVFKTVNATDNQKYDFSDLVVEAVYADNTVKTLESSEYTLHNENVNLNKRGSYEVKISYSETYDFTEIGQENVEITKENFILVLVENKAQSISFVSGKIDFKAEDDITAEDWVFEVLLENGDKEKLYYDDMVIEKMPSISGNYSVNVKYIQEQLTQGEESIVLDSAVDIVIQQPVDEGGVKTYQFAANQLSSENVADKQALPAGTTFDRGYFTVFGTVTQIINSSGAIYALEVSKGGQGGIQFTVSGTCEVTISMGSTGGSNTSAVGIVDVKNNLVANKENITHVTGTSETLMTYTLESGIYKIISPTDTTNARGARLYSIVAVETKSDNDETLKNYFFDTATIAVLPGQADESPISEGTTFVGGFFKTYGQVVQKLSGNSTLCLVVGADESGGITFTLTTTSEVVINVSSTGGSNASSVGIIDANKAAVANDQNITVVEGRGAVALSYTLEAGTYSVVSLNDTDDTRDRGARIYTISVLEKKETK